jgi:hypothetical protein
MATQKPKSKNTPKPAADRHKRRSGVVVWLPAHIEELRRRAAAKGVPVAQLVREAVIDSLERQEPAS